MMQFDQIQLLIDKTFLDADWLKNKESPSPSLAVLLTQHPFSQSLVKSHKLSNIALIDKMECPLTVHYVKPVFIFEVLSTCIIDGILVLKIFLSVFQTL